MSGESTMRKVVLDTETTGLNPRNGDKLVEIGGIELINDIRTGRSYHQYINPERDMPEAAFAVHGLSSDFLSGYPPFRDIASTLLDFLGDAVLIIHNAPFDMGFLNHELAQLSHPGLSHLTVVDTIPLARRAFPGGQVNLDALCRRFKIDLARRIKHSALLDADLLTDVYIELTGGRQPDLGFQKASLNLQQAAVRKRQVFYEPRSYEVSLEERLAHEALLSQITKPLWNNVD